MATGKFAYCWIADLGEDFVDRLVERLRSEEDPARRSTILALIGKHASPDQPRVPPRRVTLNDKFGSKLLSFGTAHSEDHGKLDIQISELFIGESDDEARKLADQFVSDTTREFSIFRATAKSCVLTFIELPA